MTMSCVKFNQMITAITDIVPDIESLLKQIISGIGTCM